MATTFDLIHLYIHIINYLYKGASRSYFPPGLGDVRAHCSGVLPRYAHRSGQNLTKKGEGG